MSARNGAVYEWLGNITVTRKRLPPGDRGVRVTLGDMTKLAREGSRDMFVREAAIRAVKMEGGAEHNALSQLAALHRWVRDNVLFVGDIAGIETVMSPRNTLRVMAGDCDDRAVLLAAMARSIGIPADLKFRVVGADPRRPGAFSHVYVVARLGGREIGFDPTYHENGPGYEYPGVTRREDFPL